MWAVLLGAAADAIKHILAAAENESRCKLQVLHTDNSGEFTSAEFASYGVDEGIQRHFSTLYSLHQNGVVEGIWQNNVVQSATRRWWPWPQLSSSSEGCWPSSGVRRC
jgi:transposase InsO family protein